MEKEKEEIILRMLLLGMVFIQTCIVGTVAHYGTTKATIVHGVLAIGILIWIHYSWGQIEQTAKNQDSPN